MYNILNGCVDTSHVTVLCLYSRGFSLLQHTCTLLLLIKYQMELTNDFFFFACVEEQSEMHHLF